MFLRFLTMETFILLASKKNQPVFYWILENNAIFLFQWVGISVFRVFYRCSNHIKNER